MPVEFLSDAQAGAYGRFVGLPSRMELERCFFLDDAYRRLVGRRRGDHNRLGFGVQLATVRFLGTFLADPVDVPDDVDDCIAAQLDVAASCLTTYAEREKTRLEHQWEIAREYGYRDFLDVEAELVRWVDDLAWTTGEGPNAIFADAIGWLRERQVLLPGVTVLARLVAREGDAATMRVWTELSQQGRALTRLAWLAQALNRDRPDPKLARDGHPSCPSTSSAPPEATSSGTLWRGGRAALHAGAARATTIRSRRPLAGGAGGATRQSQRTGRVGPLEGSVGAWPARRRS